MGNRLYPLNMNEYLASKYTNETVEKAEQFEELVESMPLEQLNILLNLNSDDQGYSVYTMRQRVEVYEEIYIFRLNGFGRLNEQCYEILAENQLDTFGSTEDKAIVDKLLSAMMISETQISGLTWG